MPFDPFSMLGLPRRFDLDPGAIESAFLARALASHPDAQAASDAGHEAAEVQADLNEARGVLLDPERRANCLLGLLGGPAKEQDKSLPPGFLGEVMDMREEMEAAMAARNAAAIAAWRARGGAERARWMGEAAARFDRATPDVPPSAGSLKEIRTILNAWRYIERLIEQLDRPGAGPA